MYDDRASKWRGPALRGFALAVSLLVLADCGGGGGTGNSRDSGVDKTYLSVAATDADGDALHYQWRVTAGSIDNRDSNATVWTLPDGPGLHFAYVVVSDSAGGYAEQQYAVATDSLGTSVASRQAVAYMPATVADFNGSTNRLRFRSVDTNLFTPPGGGKASERFVYLPDMPVQVLDASNAIVYSGLTDLGGEVDLPKLPVNSSYTVKCATSQDVPLQQCDTFTPQSQATARAIVAPFSGSRNLHLFGHVAGADGAVCGRESEFFGVQSAATVQLLGSDGQALGVARRVNRFGDYAIDAAVPLDASLQLRIQCEAWQQLVPVPSAPGGYASAQPLELSYQIPNNRPVIVKMVANGTDGNVRGRMLVPEAGAVSNQLPGSLQFLTYKSLDTRLSACRYYRALGAASDCDAQGNMVQPISFDDWKRAMKFKPYDDGTPEVSATYVNKMDLNLVRRMVARKLAADKIAFYVCNHPGPEGSTQTEVDDVIGSALADQKQVACVAMEWSTSPGANNGSPFTKFFVFGPDGALLPSINLDQRGEKYMPGACVACHGGLQHNGRFPQDGDPSPAMGSGFLAFDTGNYLFSSASSLTETAQSQSLHDLNQLVRATEASDTTQTSLLIQGWYPNGTTTLDKSYVPQAWLDAESNGKPGAARFYREIVGASCRTCHASMGSGFNWDARVLDPSFAANHVCGGMADLAINASMPNALISRDRIEQRVQADPTLATLMTNFLGCATPSPDPVYARR